MEQLPLFPTWSASSQDQNPTWHPYKCGVSTQPRRGQPAYAEETMGHIYALSQWPSCGSMLGGTRPASNRLASTVWKHIYSFKRHKLTQTLAVLSEKGGILGTTPQKGKYCHSTETNRSNVTKSWSNYHADLQGTGLCHSRSRPQELGKAAPPPFLPTQSQGGGGKH